MPNTLVRVYDRFSDAENARNALLGAGFPADHVQLVSKEDEAGPVQGNFTVGNASASRDDERSVIDSLIGADDHTYDRDYKHVAQRGSYLLMVDADNDDQLARASDITQRFGAHDIDEYPSKRSS